MTTTTDKRNDLFSSTVAVYSASFPNSKKNPALIDFTDVSIAAPIPVQIKDFKDPIQVEKKGIDDPEDLRALLEIIKILEKVNFESLEPILCATKGWFGL